jgi:hypothetical protein
LLLFPLLNLSKTTRRKYFKSRKRRLCHSDICDSLDIFRSCRAWRPGRATIPCVLGYSVTRRHACHCDSFLCHCDSLLGSAASALTLGSIGPPYGVALRRPVYGCLYRGDNHLASGPSLKQGVQGFGRNHGRTART